MANIGDAINAAKKAGQKVSSFYTKRAMKSKPYKAVKSSMRSAREYAKSAGASPKGIGNAHLINTLKQQKSKVIKRDAAIGAGVVAAGVGIKKLRNKKNG